MFLSDRTGRFSATGFRPSTLPRRASFPGKYNDFSAEAKAFLRSARAAVRSKRDPSVGDNPSLPVAGSDVPEVLDRIFGDGYVPSSAAASDFESCLAVTDRVFESAFAPAGVSKP